MSHITNVWVGLIPGKHTIAFPIRWPHLEPHLLCNVRGWREDTQSSVLAKIYRVTIYRRTFITVRQRTLKQHG